MIPISKPLISNIDKKFMLDAIESGWVSSIGKYIALAENELSNIFNLNHALIVSNGTTALQIALEALHLPKDTEVIIPDLTFAAVANAVIAAGLIPITVDVDLESWNITPETIENSITNKTKVVIVVHSYGNPAKIDTIQKLTKSKGLFLIEDCAEAHFAKYNDNYVGTFGDMATFSFYGNKIITSGEGGAVLTNSQSLYEEIAELRDHAMDKKIRFFHNKPGFNFRMTNVQAALLYSQLKNKDTLLDKRKFIFQSYNKLLSNFILPPKSLSATTPVNWLFSGRINRDPQKLSKFLNKNEIDTRPIFKPISSFPYIKPLITNNKNAMEISEQGISLPTYNEMTTEEIKFVSNKVIEFFDVC